MYEKKVVLENASDGNTVRFGYMGDFAQIPEANPVYYRILEYLDRDFQDATKYRLVCRKFHEVVNQFALEKEGETRDKLRKILANLKGEGCSDEEKKKLEQRFFNLHLRFLQCAGKFSEAIELREKKGKWGSFAVSAKDYFSQTLLGLACLVAPCFVELFFGFVSASFLLISLLFALRAKIEQDVLLSGTAQNSTLFCDFHNLASECVGTVTVSYATRALPYEIAAAITFACIATLCSAPALLTCCLIITCLISAFVCGLKAMGKKIIEKNRLRFFEKAVQGERKTEKGTSEEETGSDEDTSSEGDGTERLLV